MLTHIAPTAVTPLIAACVRDGGVSTVATAALPTGETT